MSLSLPSSGSWTQPVQSSRLSCTKFVCIWSRNLTNTHLGILVGLNTSNAFGMGFLSTMITGMESDLQMKPEYFLAFLGVRRGLAFLRILLWIKVSLKQPEAKCCQSGPSWSVMVSLLAGFGASSDRAQPQGHSNDRKSPFSSQLLPLTTCLQHSPRKPTGEDVGEYNRTGDNMSAWEVKRSKWKNRFKLRRILKK